MSNQDLLNEIIELKIKLKDAALQHYKQYELLSWIWWLNIVLVVIPIILWWIFVDKKRLMNIIVFGLLVNLVSTFLDVAGTHFVMWEYPVYTLPHLPLMVPVDYVIIPVAGMFIFQWFQKWRSFIVVSLAVSAFMSFACEPLAVYVKMYRLISWRYIYSFPIYFVIYIIAKIVTERFISKNKSNI